ncbi:hypothetical protein BDY21DRAFT_292432 [Lineolata rhizophorae]|uniref:Uncharacterized protein n=1 Tax=Lineolata rhizophorae TaxID=578093 RepID=A0A6A6NPY7_9PEZI|nr:hypothetical protein BDY21DRAFT_292432 [Lineolata rhizophorae]
MSLAYGELPPPPPGAALGDAGNANTDAGGELELRAKANRLQALLDEANCLQHSATATIDALQRNPDALAAVALTLAEISNLAAKLAPGALAALKGSFPAVVALLASPQFMIAAGVGVGVTIVALGGYKIVKRIRERKEEGMLEAPFAGGAGAPGPANDDGMDEDELRELDADMARVEMWRRGIADVQARSVGTTVDGEFVTPHASRMLVAEGALSEGDFRRKKGDAGEGGSGSGKKKGGKKEKEKERKGTRARTAKSARSERSGREREAGKRKRKEQSALRALFH